VLFRSWLPRAIHAKGRSWIKREFFLIELEELAFALEKRAPGHRQAGGKQQPRWAIQPNDLQAFRAEQFDIRGLSESAPAESQNGGGGGFWGVVEGSLQQAAPLLVGPRLARFLREKLFFFSPRRPNQVLDVRKTPPH